MFAFAYISLTVVCIQGVNHFAVLSEFVMTDNDISSVTAISSAVVGFLAGASVTGYIP